ncbi:TonB-dependent receptor plug domain-containing protein [Silanimonas sp.]|uniref:TonB-dependent receptor plug domain-containing protein n=1 Tax=Silanimonas sp. TaxID=1929290 RepID=UPI0037CB55C2
MHAPTLHENVDMPASPDRHRALNLLALSIALALSPPTLAQAEDASATEAGTRIFEPEFFASSAPVNALQMVERVPGFTIAEVGTERGFGTNAGNILIDGKRPSTKSDDIRTLLARIPADRVTRIELIERAGVNQEAQGQSRIVNVVRSASTGANGTYTLGLGVDEDGIARPFGQSSLSFERRGTQFELGLDYRNDLYQLSGAETNYDAARRADRILGIGIDSDSRQTAVTGTVRGAVGSAHWGVNAKLDRDSYTTVRISDVFNPQGALQGREVLESGSPTNRDGFELGADLEFSPTRSITTKLVGLFSRYDIVSRNDLSRSGPGLSALSQSSRNDNREDEAILRIGNTVAAGDRHSIQFGVEAVRNQLRGRFTSAIAGLPPLPASNVDVSELRIEPFISDVWSIRPTWKIEAAMIAERSTLRVRGDASASRRFLFWKPRLVSTWTLDPATTLDLRFERRAAQLDFNDYATSVDLGLGALVDAGNADLVPQRTSTLTATLRRAWLGRGSGQVRGWVAHIDDTQDLVPITIRDGTGAIVSVVDGPGNIGRGRELGVSLDLSLPLEKMLPLGDSGEVTLTYAGTYQHSRVTDPITGLQRRLQPKPGQVWAPEQQHALALRHDVLDSPFAWGANVDWSSSQTRYFYDQTLRFGETPSLGLFAEYAVARGKFRFEVDNANEYDIGRERVFYAGSRADGVVAGSASRALNRNTRVLLSFNGRF